MQSFFVFDVESVGLYGEGFAVAGGVYLENGAVQWEFDMSCPPEECQGKDEDRQWVKDNVPILEITHRSPLTLRKAFWNVWERAYGQKALMAADCLWPIEAGFVARCILDEPERQGSGPYPFVEISSILLAAGMDPTGIYDRTESEIPKHNPLCDARQSARLLAMALEKIKCTGGDLLKSRISKAASVLALREFETPISELKDFERQWCESVTADMLNASEPKAQPAQIQ